MESNLLLQIVSGFKPDVDGMGDFARILGEALWKQKGIRSHFAVYRRPKVGLAAEELAPNTISYPEEASAQAFEKHIDTLIQELNLKKAILHYGPYAYARNGRPGAFGKTIQALAGKIELMVFFHETYAKGYPWKRSFWTYREQKETVRCILKSSIVAFTSTSRVIRRLEKLNATHIRLEKIRIFSNIGEPVGLKPLNQRSNQLVVFGRLVNRLQLYNHHMLILEKICEILNVTTVVDVGVGSDPGIPKKIAHADVRSLGRLAEEDLSKLFASSIAGVLGYGPDDWEKSGVLASYEAHAMVPILLEWESRQEPVEPVIPYISGDNLLHLSPSGHFLPADRLQQIANDAHTFYQNSQSVSRCVALIADCLEGN